MTPTEKQLAARDPQRYFPTFRSAIPISGVRGGWAVDSTKQLVACLGCSHTYGLCPEEDSWPAQLNRHLGAERYQCLNMGRRGYGLKLVLDWYEIFASELELSACVLQVPLYCRQPLVDWQEDVPENYVMARGAWSLVQNGVVSHSKFAAASDRMITRDLERVSDFLYLMRERSIRTVVLLYVAGRSLEVPFHQHLERLYYQGVARLCRRRAIPVLNLTRFGGQPGKDYNPMESING